MTGLARPRVTTLPSPVSLDPSAPEATAAFVAWLRDTHTETVDVVWEATIGPGVDTALLHHLPPPVPTVGLDGHEKAVRWRTVHRPAMCYYRLGPGFVQVRDVRDPETAARYLLDEPALVDTFLRCRRPTRLAELEGAELAAAQALVAERIMLRLDDWVVVLPNRMRRWPVPSQLV